MSATRIVGIIVTFAVIAAVAYFFGKQQNASAVAVSRDFLLATAEKFRAIQLAGESVAAWVIIAGDVHGALGITDRRVFFTTVGGLEAIPRDALASITATEKNYGGARVLSGHEITITRKDGRRHVLMLIDQAEYLPAEHDASTVLARIGSA